MIIEFISYNVTRAEAQEIYNTSNSVAEINTQLMRKLNVNIGTWQTAVKTFNVVHNNFDTFLLVNYRRIIGAVPQVVDWPGDMCEAAVFSKYWDMRNALPHQSECGIVQGRGINKQDVLAAITALAKKN